MIGLMRLAWWREALERLDTGAAPAEPLLLATVEHLLPRGITGAMLAEIEDGWAALIDGEIDADAVARHARARGGQLFAIAAGLLGAPADPLRQAGALWALADLSHRLSDPQARVTARVQAPALEVDAWPRAARPLAMLAVLAEHDVTASERRQGHPKRLFRMLALRLTGR
jgi:15-cis-phytoene synthase